MKLTLSIYQNRASVKAWNKTAIIEHDGQGYRLCGVELLPGDPLLAEVKFKLEELVKAIPGLRYEPPKEG